MKLGKSRLSIIFFIIILIVIPFITIDSIFSINSNNLKPHIFDIFLDINLYPKLFLLNITLIISSIVLLIKSSAKKEKLPLLLKNRIVVFYLIYYLILIFSNFFATSTTISINESLKSFSFLVLLILSSIAISNINNFRITLSKLMVIFGFIASIIGIIQIAHLLQTHNFAINHQFTYFIKATFSHRNIYSQLLLLSLPFSIFIAISNQKFWRIFSISVSILQLILISILLVRSVWLALFISSIISALLFFISKTNKGELLSIRKTILYSSIIVGIIFITLFSFSRFDSSDTLTKQISWIKKTPFGSVKERLDLWEASVKMIKDKPLIGQGAGNWAIVLPKYYNEEIRVNKEENLFTNFQRAHNDYLQTAAEIGVIGLIFYLLIFVSSLHYLIIILKYGNKEDRLFSATLLFSIISYLIISFLSFPKERIDSTIIITTILALSIVLTDKMKEKQNTKKQVFVPFLLILILLVLSYSTYVNYEILKGEYYTKKAYIARLENKHTQVIKEISNAYSAHYKTDPTSTPLMWYSGTASFILNDVQSALSNYKQAYNDAPYHKHNLNDLATSYEIMGNHKKALEYYREAIAVSLHFTDPLLNISILFYNLNSLDSSYYYFQKININTKSNNYISLRKMILPRIINQISLKYSDNKVISNAFQSFLSSEEWMIGIYKHSIINNNSMEKQLITEAIYLLETVDKTMKKQEADQLRSKYGIE